MSLVSTPDLHTKSGRLEFALLVLGEFEKELDEEISSSGDWPGSLEDVKIALSQLVETYREGE